MESIVDTEVHPGQVLAGKFRIESILGRGGMGVVVAATHLQLDEKVALKFLLPEALKNPEAVRRFEREARAAVKIKSEHVARVTDVGQLETGAPYMVMEFLHGRDLGQYLQERGPLPLEEAVEYLLQASEAIAEAHSLGIVHRDLKPANLYRIVRSDGSPSIKVLDFGISKVTGGADPSMTHTSSMMGSPYYMSPEQMTSAKNVDQRTDVWALGIILHELLTGNVPYDGDTIPEVCAKVLQNPPPQLAELRPDLPRELNVLFEKALAKKREDRFDDVAALAAALSDYASVDGRRSIDRISRVLGVANTAKSPHPASTGDGVLGVSANTAQAKSAIDSSPSTLGGAAHTQLDYSPPTTGVDRKVLLAVAAGLLLLGGGLFALLGNKDAGDSQDPLIAVESEVSAPVSSTEQNRGPDSPETASKSDQAASDKETQKTGHDSASERLASDAKQNAQPTDPSVKSPPVVSAAAVGPETQSTTAPRPVALPRPLQAPALRPAPAANPIPAPRPAAAPAASPRPAPSPSNLYLDRR